MSKNESFQPVTVDDLAESRRHIREAKSPDRLARSASGLLGRLKVLKGQARRGDTADPAEDLLDALDSLRQEVRDSGLGRDTRVDLLEAIADVETALAAPAPR